MIFGLKIKIKAYRNLKSRPFLVCLDILTDPVEKDFVSWLLQKDINDRPFADEALKHPFLKSIEEQFNFLVVMGNEPEVIKEDQHCAVVRALNSHVNDYPNGWKETIPLVH